MDRGVQKKMTTLPYLLARLEFWRNSVLAT